MMTLKADAMAFLGMPGQPPQITARMEINLAMVTCAPPWAKTTSIVMMEAAQYKEVLLQPSNRAMVATNASDITSAFEEKLTAVVLGLQNLPDHANIHALKSVGIRVIALAYDVANMYGSGCLNLDVGLSNEGKDALQAMNHEGGMILDLAHASHRMAREALQFIREEQLTISVMASHVGCYDVYPHFRNLPDHVLREIAERGGVVGIPTLGFILGNNEKRDVGAFRAHVKHAIDVCGIESVVIGSDGTYTDVNEAQARAQFEMMRTKIDPHGTWGARYPEHPLVLLGPNKLDNIAFAIRNITNGKTNKIIGKNLVQFFERSLHI